MISNNNIPKEWHGTRLADIGTFSKGAGVLKDQVSETGFNVIRYGELYTRYNIQIKRIYSHIPSQIISSTKEIKYGDILFAGSGETIDDIGKSAVYLLEEKCYAGGDVIIFTPNNVNNLFLTYLLNTGEARKRLRELGQGQSIVHIYKSDIENIKLYLPDIDEQNRIVGVLQTWDSFLSKLIRKIDIKKKNKKGLMQKLLTGKVRLSCFNNEWNVTKLGDIFQERKEEEIEVNGFELYSLTIEDGVCPKSERYNRSFLVKSENKRYKKSYLNDIVYNPANLRYGAIALNNNPQPVLLSPIYKTLYVRNNDKYSIKYLAHLLTWERQVRKMSSYAEGTLIERMEVKIDSFKQINIDIPSTLQEQEEIARILSAADHEIEALEKIKKTVENQKKYLLSNLITGAIRTPENLSIRNE